jgi:NAD dependent epimerase/dehydratase family
MEKEMMATPAKSPDPANKASVLFAQETAIQDGRVPGGGPPLVTGATGFIGSHLVRLLLERGAPMVVASNVSGTARNLQDLRERVEIARADIGDFTDVLRLVEKHRPHTIYHVGAMLAPACDANPEAGIRANAIGTYHVLEPASLFGVSQVIFASSMSVFNPMYATTTIEDCSVTRPETVYGAAKLCSENLGFCYRRLHGLDYRGLRLPNINGPGTTSHGYLEYFNKAIEEGVSGRKILYLCGAPRSDSRSPCRRRCRGIRGAGRGATGGDPDGQLHHPRSASPNSSGTSRHGEGQGAWGKTRFQGRSAHLRTG